MAHKRSADSFPPIRPPGWALGAGQRRWLGMAWITAGWLGSAVLQEALSRPKPGSPEGGNCHSAERVARTFLQPTPERRTLAVSCTATVTSGLLALFRPTVDDSVKRSAYSVPCRRTLIDSFLVSRSYRYLPGDQATKAGHFKVVVRPKPRSSVMATANPRTVGQAHVPALDGGG